MVPNDINILTQALSEINRGKNILSSADSRLNGVLTSGNPKSNSEVADINSAIAIIKEALQELNKIKL